MPEYEDSSYPEFIEPVGLDSYDALEEGEEIEVVATIRKKPNGKACLVMVEGLEVSTGDTEEVEEEEAKPEILDRAERMRKDFHPSSMPV